MAEFFAEISGNAALILTALGQHVLISLTSILLGILVAVPAGILLTYCRKAAGVVLGIFGVVNTIPSIVLLGAAMILLGLGFAPAVAVLFLYSLLPIMRATYTGILDVSPKCLKAARGMGMSRMQTLRLVQLPLALPAHHDRDPPQRHLYHLLGHAGGVYRRRRPGRPDLDGAARATILIWCFAALFRRRCCPCW